MSNNSILALIKYFWITIFVIIKSKGSKISFGLIGLIPIFTNFVTHEINRYTVNSSFFYCEIEFLVNSRYGLN